jgi:Molybdopterin cofactor-binding domain
VLGLLAERDRLRRQGLLAGIGMAACLEPSGANSTFELLLNPKNETTTYSDSCRINVDLSGAVTATIHTLSAGQGHETLVATVMGEVLEIDPDGIRVVRPDSLSSLPSKRSRMAIMLGGAAFHAAQKLKARLLAIAAHDLKIPLERATYDAGHVFDRVALQNRRSWAELVTIAHRHFHRLPPDTEPGLAFTHVMQVPTGGQLPTADGRVQAQLIASVRLTETVLHGPSRLTAVPGLKSPRAIISAWTGVPVPEIVRRGCRLVCSAACRRGNAQFDTERGVDMACAPIGQRGLHFLPRNSARIAFDIVQHITGRWRTRRLCRDNRRCCWGRGRSWWQLRHECFGCARN